MILSRIALVDIYNVRQNGAFGNTVDFFHYVDSRLPALEFDCGDRAEVVQVAKT